MDGTDRPLPADGVLNLNKPAGITSRCAVDLVERAAGRIKAGHAGTLDPLACGVLVVCIGRATRLIEYVQGLKKCYEAMFLLGRESPTEDVDGPVTELTEAPVPSLAEVLASAAALTGKILQRPPAYSALKVRGRRSYDLRARVKRSSLRRGGSPYSASTLFPTTIPSCGSRWSAVRARTCDR